MLAIVIPYYKITYFEQTLNSLAVQSNNNFNVYIGDDASPEDPGKIIHKYEDKLNLSYKKFNKNLGLKSLVKQWERCIDLIHKEKWIMILGDDDILDKNVVEHFYINLLKLKNDICLIRFATSIINHKGELISEKFLNPKTELSIDFLFKNRRSSLSEHVFKVKPLVNNGFKNFPLGWFSDLLAILEVTNFKTIYSINEATINIRKTELSISGDRTNLAQKQVATYEFYFYLLNNYYNKFDKNQKEILLEKVSKCYLNRKKNFKWFIQISKFYLSKFLVFNYLFFLKRIMFNLIERKF